MVDMRTCSFCGEAIDPGTGKMFIRRDGTISYFCSSKCKNNAKLGRVPRRVRWTRAGRKALGKE
jgi:large subunit ribosomal protein L24e